jgi:hypothetical protein
MKTLVVCGCSWSSRDPLFPNFEFGFLVAKALGYNYVNLARCGMSNFGIRLQIDYALEHYNPDFIIINATGVNRFEILKDIDNTYDPSKGYDQVCFGDFDWDHFDHEHHPSYGDRYDPQIWCDSMYTVLSQEARRYQQLDPERVDALKNYAYYVFDENIKSHTDYFVLQSGLQKILNHNIPFLFSPNTFDFSEFDKTGLNEEPHHISSFNWDFIPDKYYLDKGAAMAAQHNLEIIDETGTPTKHYPVSHHNGPYAHQKYAEYIISELNKRQFLNF